MKFHKKIFALCLMFCLFFLSSCGDKDSSKKNTETNNTTKLTIGCYSSESYNPLLIKTDYNRQCFALIFDSLYNMDKNFRAIENIASDLYVEDGGTTVTIRIKSNIKFHDGQELTADDVAKSIEFITNSEENYYKYNVRNIISATAKNDYTVILKLNSPAPNIKSQLTFPIISASDLAEEKFPLNGSGPYKLKSENSGKELKLELNKDYHRDFSTKITDVEVEFVPDLLTARSLAGSGIVDAVFASFYDEGLKTVTKSQSLKDDYPTDEYTFLQLNYDNSIMYLKPFRKVLSLLVDREKLQNDAFMSHGEKTVLPVNPLSWIDSSSYVIERDVDSVKETLKQMGYEDKDDDNILDYVKADNDSEGGEEPQNNTSLPNRLSFKVLYLDSNLKKSVFTSIQKDFFEAGIELIPTSCENYEDFLNKYTNKEYDICIVTTNIGYDGDLEAFMSLNGSYASPLELGYENTLSKLSATTEENLKNQIYKQALDNFYETMPHIPLMFLNKTLIKSSKLNSNNELFVNNIYYKILEK